MYENESDELRLFRGRDRKIQINENLTLTVPTLDEIERYGEQRYFGAIYTLTSVGADMKWQLWDMGIDYTTIEDYDLFVKLISKIVGSKHELYDAILENPELYEGQFTDDEIKDMLKNPLEIILNVDLGKFKPCILHRNNQLVLYDEENDITIDRYAYMRLMEIVRKLHNLKRNNQIPANETTKMDLIDDARDDYFASLNKPHESMLLPLISTVQVYCGQVGDEKIWNLTVMAFFETIKRIGKIQDAMSLLNGAYSGFANLKGIDKSRLDMFSK